MNANGHNGAAVVSLVQADGHARHDVIAAMLQVWPEAAVRMAQRIEAVRWGDSLVRSTLYFTDEGKQIRPGGKAVMKAGGVASDWRPRHFWLAIEYPFCPGIASCADMLRDLADGLCPVVYDEERWESDPRIPEQAGPSVLSDVDLAVLIEQVAA